MTASHYFSIILHNNSKDLKQSKKFINLEPTQHAHTVSSIYRLPK